ncbi:MAG: sugar transferase [Clostridiales bacterium]|nr:sugar transferase [Clostridiales bacterium]
MYKNCLKRFFDLTISFLAIVILSWLFLIIAIVIKCDSKGPVFFKQKRVGKNKKHFTILKFRTMRTDTPPDAPTHELSDPKRWITKVGSFLRKTSLDELPQIFNIFVGHMSIIGPRPALWNQFDLIEERDKYKANDVRPGLTGWAQINGRDELAIPVKAKLDGEYVEKMGFLFDCKCFFGTIKAVLTRKGVVEGENKPEEENTVNSEVESESHDFVAATEDCDKVTGKESQNKED